MPAFGVVEADYFCKQFSQTPGRAEASFRALTSGLTRGRAFAEGTRDFDELRDCSLRESERLLFLALSQYRRSFDLLMPSSASWALVTMYYGSFHAAAALLGMFGNWHLSGSKIIDVTQATRGSQVLTVETLSTSYHGSHQRFWELFYLRAASLLPWVDPGLQYALLPVSGDVAWLISTRNDMNYDSFAAHQSLRAFQLNFRRSRLASSLPGPLSTHFQILDGLIQIALTFARQFGLATDSLDQLSPPGTRKEKVRQLILDSSIPDLRQQIRRRRFLG
jgi:hypothetical protein